MGASLSAEGRPLTVQAALHVELQVGPRWELRGVGQFVVLALLGRDRARAHLGAARHNMSRPITSVAGVDIVEDLKV